MASGRTLVDVQVEDEDGADAAACPEEDLGRDGEVGKDAEARSRVAERVVRAAGRAARQAVLQRQVRGHHRAWSSAQTQASTVHA